jgi:hypothetical protein
MTTISTNIVNLIWERVSYVSYGVEKLFLPTTIKPVRIITHG